MTDEELIVLRIGPLKNMIWHSDLRPVRFLIYFGAILWAVFAELPGDMLARPEYHVMKAIMGEQFWGAYFGMYGMFGFLRWAGPTRIPAWVIIAHNLAGVMLWSSSTLAIMLSSYPPAIYSIGGIVLSVAAFWVLLRSPFRPVVD